MTPEKLFHELLGLNWEVIESCFERESGTVFLDIRETTKLWELARCLKAGGLVFGYDHIEELTQRHLNFYSTVARSPAVCRAASADSAATVGGIEHAFHQGVSTSST